MKIGKAVEEEGTTDCRYCGFSRLSERDKVRNGTEERHEKSPSCHSGPHTISADQDRGKRDSVRRPHRPKIAAPDVCSSLTEFACYHIGRKDERSLQEVLSLDCPAENASPNGASDGSVSLLELDRKC